MWRVKNGNELSERKLEFNIIMCRIWAQVMLIFAWKMIVNVDKVYFVLCLHSRCVRFVAIEVVLVKKINVNVWTVSLN